MERKRQPLEWKAFAKSLPYQPLPVFILLCFLVEPVSRLTPWLLRASCEGRVRTLLQVSVQVVYIAAGVPLACAAYYLGFARRRIPPSPSRFVADISFVLAMLVGVATSAKLVSSLAARWSALQPGIAALRDGCWK